MDPDVAPVEGDNSPPVDHRPSRLRESVAAPRWPSLDLQSLHRMTMLVCLCLSSNRSVVPSWNTIFNWPPGLGGAKSAGPGHRASQSGDEVDGGPVRCGSLVFAGVAMTRSGGFFS